MTDDRQHNPDDDESTIDADSPADDLDSVGPYRILQEIGTGGWVRSTSPSSGHRSDARSP
jgi:hypothetical protein